MNPIIPCLSKLTQAVPFWLGAVLLVSACQAPPSETPGDLEGTPEAAEPTFEDVESPVGGLVKQVTIPGPETAVLVACDQEGFEPFLFADQGNWVGCQIRDGFEPGPASALSEPFMESVPSPVGGMVQQVTIPGPETSVRVTCGQAGFEPFFYTEQGDWVGCKAG